MSMTPLQPGTDPAPPRPRSWLARHRTNLLFVALLVAVIIVQWPMFKGVYYRVTGTPPPAGMIAWRTDFEAALAEAKQLDRPLLVDFTASWCPPCQTMKHDVWPDRKVGQTVMGSFVPVLIDVDRDGAVAARYGIQSIPTVMIVSSDGQVLHQEVGGMSRGQVLAFLRLGAGAS